jgi:hypothetical protein
MAIVESWCEWESPGRLRVITVLDVATAEVDDDGAVIGEGPTGDAIPDRIVRALVECCPEAMTPTELHDMIGGNRATINRQAWTLANNTPDLQRRLRGWVTSSERGRYTLSRAARERIDAEHVLLRVTKSTRSRHRGDTTARRSTQGSQS